MNATLDQQKARAQQYLRQQIEQASPLQQVVMLYDGAIKFLMQAKEAIGRGDVEARHNANRRVMEIVGYLLDMCDPVGGGDAGKALHRIYSGILKQLIQIDFKNDAAVCEEAIANFRALRASMGPVAAAPKGEVVAAPVDTPAAAVRRNAVA